RGVGGVRHFYMDASALTKRYAPEPGTPLIHYLFGQASDRLYLLNLGFAEVAWSLVRKKNTGRISTTLLSQALVNLWAEIIHDSSVTKVVPDNTLVSAALPLIDVHSLNATDAVMLRSALDYAGQLRSIGDDLVLVASDQRLLRAAQAEGLVIFNP